MKNRSLLMIQIHVVFCLLFITGISLLPIQTKALDTPGLRYLNNYKAAKFQITSPFKVVGQIKQIPHDQSLPPHAYQIEIQEHSILVTPISLQKDKLYFWKIQNKKVSKLLSYPYLTKKINYIYFFKSEFYIEVKFK